MTGIPYNEYRSLSPEERKRRRSLDRAFSGKPMSAWTKADFEANRWFRKLQIESTDDPERKRKIAAVRAREGSAEAARKRRRNEADFYAIAAEAVEKCATQGAQIRYIAERHPRKFGGQENIKRRLKLWKKDQE